MAANETQLVCGGNFFIQFFKLNYSIFLIIKCALSSDSTLWEINNPIYYYFSFLNLKKVTPKIAWSIAFLHFFVIIFQNP